MEPVPKENGKIVARKAVKAVFLGQSIFIVKSCRSQPKSGKLAKKSWILKGDGERLFTLPNIVNYCIFDLSSSLVYH